MKREIIDGAKLLVLIDLKTENEVEILLAKQALILDLLHSSNQDEDVKQVLFKHFSLLKEALKKASFFFNSTLQTLIYGKQ